MLSVIPKISTRDRVYEGIDVRSVSAGDWRHEIDAVGVNLDYLCALLLEELLDLLDNGMPPRRHTRRGFEVAEVSAPVTEIPKERVDQHFQAALYAVPHCPFSAGRCGSGALGPQSRIGQRAEYWQEDSKMIRFRGDLVLQHD